MKARMQQSDNFNSYLCPRKTGFSEVSKMNALDSSVEKKMFKKKDSNPTMSVGSNAFCAPSNALNMHQEDENILIDKERKMYVGGLCNRIKEGINITKLILSNILANLEKSSRSIIKIRIENLETRASLLLFLKIQIQYLK
jgi:hypothetical protein